MSNIKIKLSVDANDTGQVTALSNYLQALKTLAEAKRPLTAPTPKTPVKEEKEVVATEVPGKPKASSPTPSEAESTEASTKKSPTSTRKTKSSTAKKASSTEPTETSTPKATPKATGSKDLREPLRELLSEKVGDHREEIKKELAKYDAKNITRLPEDHHEEFMAFMQKLD